MAWAGGLQGCDGALSGGRSSLAAVDRRGAGLGEAVDLPCVVQVAIGARSHRGTPSASSCRAAPVIMGDGSGVAQRRRSMWTGSTQ